MKYFFTNIFLWIFIYKSLQKDNFSIIFPFTTISEKDPELTSEYNITKINNIMRNIYINDIYLKLELGSPLQKINIRLSSNSDDFFVSKDIAVFEEQYSKKNGSFYFNPKKSSTFTYRYEDQGHIYFSHPHLSEYVKDSFLFHSTGINNENILLKNFSFLLAYKVNGPNHGIIGFKGGISEDFRRDDIFTALRKNSLIKNDIWYLNYDNKLNGSVFIGNYPHDDNNIPKIGKNELLTINHFRKVYTTMGKSWDGQWGLTFDKIYMKNNSNGIFEEILDYCKTCKNVILSPCLGVIIGPKKYKFLFEDMYMNKYLDNKICFQPMIKLRRNFEDKTYYYYYCNASYIQQMKKDFNDIIFEHKEFNFNFSITFDDIYIQKDKFIFIRIIFEDFHGASWVLGSPFMSKYLFTFNSDSKEIGFYSKNINDKIEIVDKKSNFSFSIFIEKIMIGAALIIVGIFLGRKLFGLRRKLRANELEEKFEYKPAEKQIQLF